MVADEAEHIGNNLEEVGGEEKRAGRRKFGLGLGLTLVLDC